jgi:fibronectin-binding autotransporter adhesin
MINWFHRRRSAKQPAAYSKLKNRFRLALETLEDRRVLATATFNVHTVLGLYQAVASANRLGQTASSTINIAPGTYTLNAGTLSVNSNIRFHGTGAGPNKTTISGGGTVGVFEVGNTATAILNDTWSNLTITDGNTAGNGGGVDGNLDNLSFINANITSNNAANSGGGIFLTDGRIALSNTSLTNNRAGTNGGGIDVFGSTSYASVLVLAASHVDFNKSDPMGSGIGGGGIFQGQYLAGDIMRLTNSTVDFNTTGGDGGGIDGGGLIALSNSHIDGNLAMSSGGGVFLSPMFGGSFTMTNNSTVGQTTATFGNTAEGTGGGGGLFVGTQGSTHASSISLTKSQISGNVAAAGDGGGINAFTSNIYDLSLSLNSSSLNANLSTGWGGGLALGTNSGDTVPMPDFTVNINLSSVSNNKSGSVDNSNPGGGGALILTLTSATVNATVTKSTFANNYAAGKGGGLFLHSTAGIFTANVSQDAFTGNTSGNYGGGVWLGQFATTGSLNLVNDTISNNTAVGYGGGIQISYGGSSVTNGTNLVNLTVSSNHSYDGVPPVTSSQPGDGGGINVGDPADDPSGGIVSLGNCIIVQNTSGAIADDLEGTFSYTFNGVTPLGAPNIASSVASVSGSNFFTDVNNFVGNPNLGPLAFNTCQYSPPTKTRAITASSLAALKGSITLDAAFANLSALVDQGGFKRQASHPGKVDLGAYD